MNACLNAILAAALLLRLRDIPLVRDVLFVLIGVFTLVTAFAMRSLQARQAWLALRPFAWMAIVPMLWMGAQLAPIPAGYPGAHAVWASAAAAFDAKLAGHVTADIGATLFTLVGYAMLAAFGAALCYAAVDRERAESFHVTLGAWSIPVCGLAGLLYAARQSLGFLVQPTALIVGLCAIYALTNAFRCYERMRTRGSRQTAGGPAYGAQATLWLAAMAMDVSGVRLLAARASFIAICGVLGFLTFVFLLRRIDLGRWTMRLASAACLALVCGLALSASGWSVSGPDLMRFVERGAQGMIADNRWTGVGAGASEKVAVFYAADLQEAAVTEIGVLVAEFGYPAAAVFLVLALAALLLLLRGAVERGRDSFYPLAGVGAVIVVLAESLQAGAIYHLSFGVFAAAGVFLGVAQRIGRQDR